MKPQPSPLPSGASKILVAIGEDDDRDWPDPLRQVLAAHRVVHVPWPRLTGGFLRTLAPDTVITPLVAGKFDALEVAAWLSRHGVDARLVVVVPRALPDSGLVQREIAQAGDGMRVDLLFCE